MRPSIQSLCATGYSRTIKNIALISIVVPLTMPLTSIMLLFNLLFLLPTANTAATATPPQPINITTVTTNAQKVSILQCWQLTAPFITESTSGYAGPSVAQLGETGATSYEVIPGGFNVINGKLHNPPAVQWVAPCIRRACKFIRLTFYSSILGMSPSWLVKCFYPCRTQHRQQQFEVAGTGSFS